MSTIKRELVPGNYYHIYNRGVGKQKIFLDESDKKRFTNLLYLCNGEFPFRYTKISAKELFNFSFSKGKNLTEICSWVLMDNHFHILLFVPQDVSGENISKFLTKLTSSYLKYFNEKYGRTGTLFEGRYQCLLVDDNLYLKYLYSYIHLNPLKLMDPNWKLSRPKSKKCKTYLDDYKYSSYYDLVLKKKRPEDNILTTNVKVLEVSRIANTIDKLISIMQYDPRGS